MQVQLVLPVAGSGNTAAQAVVRVTEGSDNSPELSIQVQLPNGQVVTVSPGDSGQSGQGRVIDVDWKEVR